LTTCADSSFLVSKYIPDSHSLEADRRMRLRPLIWLTPFNRTEFAHAVHQYVFRKTISAAEAQLVWTMFEEDWPRLWDWIPRLREPLRKSAL
jgi:hypothetical protein